MVAGASGVVRAFFKFWISEEAFADWSFAFSAMGPDGNQSRSKYWMNSLPFDSDSFTFWLAGWFCKVSVALWASIWIIRTASVVTRAMSITTLSIVSRSSKDVKDSSFLPDFQPLRL